MANPAPSPASTIARARMSQPPSPARLAELQARGVPMSSAQQQAGEASYLPWSIRNAQNTYNEQQRQQLRPPPTLPSGPLRAHFRQPSYAQDHPNPIFRPSSPTSSISSSSYNDLSSAASDFSEIDEKRSSHRRTRSAARRKASKTLSVVALEAVEEEKERRRTRRRGVWSVGAWTVGGLLQAWVGWLVARYFVAFLLYADDDARRKMNLAFFIVSLYSCLMTVLPLLVLVPLFSRPRPSRLSSFAHLSLVLSSLFVIAVAAVQILLFKLWENAASPRGFVGRCGWDMDSTWGTPNSSCGGYRWDGWVGVLSARLGGSFVLIALLHLSILGYIANAPPSPIQLPSSPKCSSQQSLLPTTLLDRYHPRLLSDEFHPQQLRRQSDRRRSSRSSKRENVVRYQDGDASDLEESRMVEKLNRREETRFQTGYLRPLGEVGVRRGAVVDLSEGKSEREGWRGSTRWGASSPQVGSSQHVFDRTTSTISRKPVAAYVSSASSVSSSSDERLKGGREDEDGSDFGDDEEEDQSQSVYPPAFNRISCKIRTIGQSASPSMNASPFQARSSLPSSPSMTFPLPPSLSPPAAVLSHAPFFQSFSHRAPLSPATTLVQAFPLPPPTLPSRSLVPKSYSTPNPYAYTLPPSSPPSSSVSEPDLAHSVRQGGWTSPPPPRDAPDLMLGSVWAAPGEEGDGMEWEHKRLSTIVSEEGEGREV